MVQTTGILVGRVRDSAKTSTPHLSALTSAILAQAPLVEAEEVSEEPEETAAIPEVISSTDAETTEAQAPLTESIDATGEKNDGDTEMA